MQATVEILGKKVQVEWSAAADRQLQTLTEPMPVEMELYFSCLIRKRVLFDAPQRGEAAWIGQGLSLSFRPVMSRGGCSMSGTDPEGLLVDLPTGEPQRFVPRWLKLDYRRGEWRGEFGY